MKKETDLSLILACYREAPVFEESVSSILRVLDRSGLSFEIIFVDDKSPDETPELIDKICKKFPFCHALYHNSNTGRGRAVTDGIEAAKGKIVGHIDMDCEVSPVYIPEIVEMLLAGKADMVIGNRIYRTSMASIFREVLSRGYRWLSDLMIGTGGVDTEAGYKFYNRKKILPILLKVENPHWFWDTESVVMARRAGLRIVGYPVLFLRRTDKQSSVNIVRDTVDYVLNLWKFRQKLRGTESNKQ